MDDKIKLKPLALALGTTFAVSLAASPIVNAADNPFAAVEYGHGYRVADHHEGQSGESKSEEGKCGGGQEAATKSGEGSCGEGQGAATKSGEGKCGEDMDDAAKGGEGKCGS